MQRKKKQAEGESDYEPGNITKAQKEKMKDKLGSDFKELKAKPKQRVSIIIINPNGQILHKVKSLSGIKTIEEENRPVLVKNSHIFGKHTLLQNGNAVLYVDANAFKKLEKQGTKIQRKLLSQRKKLSTRSRVQNLANQSIEDMPVLEDVNQILSVTENK